MLKLSTTKEKGCVRIKSFRTYGNLERIIDWKRRGEENDVKVLTLRISRLYGEGTESAAAAG